VPTVFPSAMTTILAPFSWGVLPRVATTVQSTTRSPASHRLTISLKTGSIDRSILVAREREFNLGAVSAPLMDSMSFDPVQNPAAASRHGAETARQQDVASGRDDTNPPNPSFRPTSGPILGSF